MAPDDTWVALLRAVNLGPRNRVPMADLRRALELAGYEDVRTYIASGNVLVAGGRRDAGEVAEDVAAVVEREFRVETVAIVRSGRRLEEIVAAHPFGGDTSRSHVTFLGSEPSAAAIARLEQLDAGDDRFELRGADLLLHYPNGVQGSRLTSAAIERELGVPATNRTWRTVAKLAELARA